MTVGTESGLTRRSFLKTAGAVGAMAAAGSGLTLGVVEAAAADEATETKHKGVCRGNCGSRCPMQVTVREGKVVKTIPMPEETWVGDEGATRRRFCVKGYAQPQRVYDPDRLKYPMKRATWSPENPQPELRGQGEWVRVTWDEAIADIAMQIGTGVAKFGGTSFGVWSSYGSYGVLNGAMGGFMSVAYGRIITMLGGTVLGAGADTAQQQEQSTVLGISGNDFIDARNSKLIVNWGGNPAEAYVHAWQFVCDARERGAKMVTIDPQFTVAAAHSDMYVPIIPGTDGAMMLAMVNYIADNGMMDTEYMRNNTVSPFLVKEDGKYLRMSALGGEVIAGPPDAYGQPTVIDAVAVYDEADGTIKALAEAVKPAIEGTFDVEELSIKVSTVYTTCRKNMAEYTVAKASAITGVPEETIVKLATMYATAGPVYTMTFQGLGHHVNSHHNYKNLAMLHAITGNAGKPGASICGSPSTGLAGYNTRAYMLGMFGARLCGMSLPEIMEKNAAGAIPVTLYTLWCCNGNMLSCESGRQELIAAVKKVPFVVCADVNMTDTAEYADYVLPVPHSFEVQDIDVVCSVPYPNYGAKMIDPLFDCKSDIDIMRGVTAALNPNFKAYAIDFVNDSSDEDWLREVVDIPSNTAFGVTADELMSGKMVPQPGYGKAGHVAVYGTSEASRLKYYSEAPAVRVAMGQPVADYEKYPYYMPANESYAENPDVVSGKYPLFGCSEHGKYHVHSQLAYTPVIRELEPEPRIKINASDAAARGIKQGDWIRTYNDHGECVCKALVTEGIMPGVISIPHGFQRPQFLKGHAQDLTNVYMNDFCSNSAFYDFVCQVEKYEGDMTPQADFVFEAPGAVVEGGEQ